MKVKVKTENCPYCRGEVEERYSHSSWVSRAECSRCGTKWEKQYDEYDLANIRVKRGYGSTYAVESEDNTIKLDFLYEKPSEEDLETFFEQIRGESYQTDRCFAIFECEGEWVKKFANGDIETLI